MKTIQLRDIPGAPASLAIGRSTFQRGKWHTVPAGEAEKLLSQQTNGEPMFEEAGEGKVEVVKHQVVLPNGSVSTEVLKARRSVHSEPPPSLEDHLGPKIHPTPFIPRVRQECSVLFRGPMVSGHSISQVIRNVTVAAWRSGYDAFCTEIDTLPEYPTFLSAVDHLSRKPKGAYVTVAWDPAVKNWSSEEQCRCHIDPSDSFRYVHDNVIEEYCSDDVSLLFTLSEMCKERWVSAGVPEEKVVVISLGVDPVVFNPQGRKHDLETVKWHGEGIDENTFIFMLSGYLQHRKGVPEALSAYLNEFSDNDNVALLIKNCSDAAWGKDVRPLVNRLLSARGDGAPTVGYLDQRLSDWEFASLLRRADCLVNTHHMEGFGLIPLQAMACGTLIAVTDYHGPKAYANSENAILIPIKGETEAREKGVPPGVLWADFEVEAVQESLRTAFSGKVTAKLVKQAQIDSQSFTWKRTAHQIMEAVQENVSAVKYRPTRWAKKNLEVSIVAPVRGGVPLLRRMIETIENTAALSHEYIVYDDANTPADQALLAGIQRDFPVKIIGGTVQRGCHAARQMLYEATAGEYIFSLDGDLDFRATQPGWDEQITELCAETWGIIHPLLLLWPNGDGQIRVQSMGGTIPENKLCPQEHRFAYAPIQTVGETLYAPAEVVYACGAFQAFHSTLFDDAIMDGEYYPAYFGDVDFCYRMRRAKHPVWYSPEVVVIHDAGAWTGKNTGTEVNNWFKNQQRFLNRWGDMVTEEKLCLDETGVLSLNEPNDDAREAVEFAVSIMEKLPVRKSGAEPVL